MPLTRLVSGRLREVWTQTTPLPGGGSTVVQTDITVSNSTLGHIFGLVDVAPAAGAPVIGATASIVNGRLAVTISNTGDLASTATWKLDVWYVYSTQQASDGSTTPTFHIIQGGSGGSSGISQVADWQGVRYIFLDGDNGNDANVGYIDAPAGTTFTPLQAAAVAVKTTHRINEIRPPVGAGRQVIVLMKPRAGRAKYDAVVPGDGLGADDRTLRSNYELMVTRGSDLTNSLADRAQMGYVTGLPGPNADGSFTIAGVAHPPSGGVALTLTGAVLPAGWALRKYRLRIQSAISGTLYAAVFWGDVAAAPDASIVTAAFVAGAVNPGDFVWLEVQGTVVNSYFEAVDHDVFGALRAYGLAVQGGQMLPGALAVGTLAQYSGIDVDGTTGASFASGLGGGSFKFTNVVTDEIGTLISFSHPGVSGPATSTLGGPLTESVDIQYSTFADSSAAIPIGAGIFAHSINLSNTAAQRLAVADGVQDAAIDSCLLGPSVLLTQRHGRASNNRFVPYWLGGLASPYLVDGLTITVKGGDPPYATSAISVELASNAAFWGAEPTEPGYALSPGLYTVALDMSNLNPGNGLDLYFDPSDNTKKIPVTYDSLSVTGFEIEGGQKVVCHRTGVNYPGDTLPCPRGVVLQAGQSEGSSDLPAGTIVATQPAQTIFILADTTLDPRRCAGVLLTSCHVGMLATDGYAVVGNDGEMVVVGDGEGIGNAPWGKGVMLKAGSPGNVTCDVLESAAGWFLGQGLPAGPGDTFHSFIAWRPGMNPQTTQVSLQAPLDLVDDTLTSSADLNVDLGLGKYVVEFELPFTTGTGSPTTPGCKCVPGGGSGFIASASFTLTATRITDASGAPSPGIDACKTGVILNDTPVPSDTASQGVWVGRGFLVVTQAGLFTPRFAQVTTDGAHPTTIQAGAQMTITAIWPT